MAKSLHKEQNLELKCKALSEVEKEKTNKEVGQLFGVPANTLGKKNEKRKQNEDKIFITVSLIRTLFFNP